MSPTPDELRQVLAVLDEHDMGEQGCFSCREGDAFRPHTADCAWVKARATAAALPEEMERVREALRAIAVRGGPGHWTWPIIDAAVAAGQSERWYAEDEARREREEAELDAKLAAAWEGKR